MENEEINYHILVKYSNIRQLDIGHDAFRQPCKYTHFRHPLSLMVDRDRQLSLSIYTRLLASRKRFVMVVSEAPDVRASTRRVNPFLPSMATMPALPHMRITCVSSSPTRTISSNLRKCAISRNANLSLPVLLTLMPIRCASSGRISSILFRTGSKHWAAGKARFKLKRAYVAAS